MTRRGLGRGLDALLGATDGSVAEVREAPVDAIVPNPLQPRQHIDETALAELAESVRIHGLIQPLVVRPGPDAETYTLIAGERRWRAARLAGLERVPVVVRDATEREMLALAIVENVQRADLDPIEAAEGYRRLMESFGLTQADVADLVGKSRPVVANAVRLLGLPDDVRDLVAGGHLTEGHARALLALDDTAEQSVVARKAAAAAWTVRRVETEVRARSEAASGGAVDVRPETARGALDPGTAAAERSLERALGTRVEIRRRGEGGQIVVHFFSEEELAALFERLAGDERR